MSLNAGKILEINITLDSKETILENIKKYLNESSKITRKSFVIVTPNSEQIVLACNNPLLKKILNQADVSLPDGFPIARTLHISRIPGVEFMEDLVELASKQSYRIGLIGGQDGLAVKAFECLQKKYHGLQGWAIKPESYTFPRIVKKIKESGVKIVFVGLGAPKQEFFIEKILKQCPVVFMSVGGSFDIIAGKIQRAPFLIRSIGFEWAWRLFQEPWRWRRQLALLTFVGLVIKEKLASQGSPPAGGLRS